MPKVEAERGLVVEDSEGRFCGAVVGYEKGAVTLEDRHGKRRVFPLAPAAFLLEGQPVTLIPPAPAAPAGPARTASGFGGRAPVRPGPRWPAPAGYTSRASTTPNWWRRSGATTCATSASWSSTWRASTTCQPSSGASPPRPDRRLGVLVDHLVAGSKETRIAASVRSPDVLIVGHPFIDIWAAVRPSAVGITAWPDVPPGQPWKEGVLRAIGWPPEVPAAWQRILRSVTSYADLEPELLGRVEELIDFVTMPGSGIA